MTTLHVGDPASNPFAREQQLMRQLWAAGISRRGQVRVTISGRQLFVDGYVESLEQKLRVERACRVCAPGSTVVNRLRIAAEEGGEL